ncbi:ion channel [Roseibium polysiphoniae]|uniref:ion channel n=1 Tax=Roseibium polysiphoniae TaxID=2571221 RepID=UPI00329965FA
MNREADEFFRLIDPYKEISSAKGFWDIVEGKEERKIESILFRPDELDSREPPKKWRIRNKSFFNVSFAKTRLVNIEFSDCRFNRCLFIGSTLTDCRFNNCKFVETNFFRAEIQRCYLDPKAFKECVNSEKYPNVGLALYQELLNNSRQQAQPDFAREAQYQFARWKRYEKFSELRTSNHCSWKKTVGYLSVSIDWIFEKTTGSGMRLSNLAITAAIVLALLTALNYQFSSSFGLELNNLVESFYFSTIVVTSLGFGDITPTTCIGRAIVAIEAILGFLIFAILVSMIFRRITS